MSLHLSVGMGKRELAAAMGLILGHLFIVSGRITVEEVETLVTMSSNSHNPPTHHHY